MTTIWRVAVFAAALSAAAVGGAAAASRIFIVHGVPGVPVDVYASVAGAPIPPTATVAGFQPKQVVAVAAPAGQFDIRIYPAGANPLASSPVIQALGAVIPDNVDLSIVAHLDGQGMPTATVYQNDDGPVAAGFARVSVRHTAAAPAVALTAGGVPKLALSNPFFGDLEVPAGVPIPLQLVVPFSSTAITPQVPLAFASGRRYFVYAIGSVAQGTFDFIVHVAP
jgi:hypothetical protein